MSLRKMNQMFYLFIGLSTVAMIGSMMMRDARLFLLSGILLIFSIVLNAVITLEEKGEGRIDDDYY